MKDRQGGDPVRVIANWLRVNAAYMEDSLAQHPEEAEEFAATILALAAATPALSEDRLLREALDDAMIVAAILRGDPSTASLANRLDVSLHKALALRAAADSRPAELDVERLARAIAAWWGRDVNERVKTAGTFTVSLDVSEVTQHIARHYLAEADQAETPR